MAAEKRKACGRKRKRRRKTTGGRQDGEVCLAAASRVTHHVLDDLVLAILSLHFEEMVAEVKEVEAALLPQQHDDGAAGPVQPIAKALSERLRTFEFQIWKVVMARMARNT